MARSDTRYLKRQWQGWYFVMAIPTCLRGRFISSGRHGKAGRPLTKIVISLGTQSLAEAQDKRWPLVHEWRERFKRATANVPLTLTEIDALGRESYAATLVGLERWAKRTDDPAKFNHGLAEVAGLLQHGIADSGGIEPFVSKGADEDFEPIVASEIARIEARTGVTLDPDSETYHVLREALVRARLAAIEGRLRAAHGQPSEPPASFLGARGVDPVTLRPIVALPRPQIRVRADGQGMTFSEAAARYLDEAQRDATAKLSEHTRRQRETVFRLFKDFTNDAPLAAIDRRTAADFLDVVAKLDPDWHAIPNAQKLTIGELVEKSANRSGQLSNRTINIYATALNSVFKWADKRGHFEGRNPFQGQSRKTGDGTGWRAYSVEELSKLFGTALLRDTSTEQRIRPAKHTFDNAMAWVPLVALYSGMRSNEICQMRAADVQRKDRVWIFNVSAEGIGQSLKTEAATRIVPVHSELIRCGFLEYLNALPSDGQLWPALKPGGPDGKFNHYFAKRFTLYRRNAGVTAPRTSFHSFRKNAAQALKDALTTPAEIAELIGHERGFTVETYAPMQLPVLRLKSLIERIKYPGLRLNHLRTA